MVATTAPAFQASNQLGARYSATASVATPPAAMRTRRTPTAVGPKPFNENELIIRSIAVHANEDETGAQHRAPTANALARDLGWTNGSNGQDAVCAAEEQGS